MRHLSVFCFILSACFLFMGLVILFGNIQTTSFFWLFMWATGVFFASLGMLFETYSYTPYSREKRKERSNKIRFHWGLVVLSVILLGLLSSCSSKNHPSVSVDKVVVINEYDNNDGRPMFTVIVNDSTHTHMYAEEIANGLLTGDWICNDQLTLVNQ